MFKRCYAWLPCKIMGIKHYNHQIRSMSTLRYVYKNLLNAYMTSSSNYITTATQSQTKQTLCIFMGYTGNASMNGHFNTKPNKTNPMHLLWDTLKMPVWMGIWPTWDSQPYIFFGNSLLTCPSKENRAGWSMAQRLILTTILVDARYMLSFKR